MYNCELRTIGKKEKKLIACRVYAINHVLHQCDLMYHFTNDHFDSLNVYNHCLFSVKNALPSLKNYCNYYRPIAS